MSLQVGRLEKDLGFALLTRVGRSIELTPEGQQAYERAMAIIEPFQNFTLWADEVGKRHLPIVRVICSSTPGGYIVPAVLPTFNAKYPNVEVDLRVVMSNEMEAALEATPDLDFALYNEELPFRGLAVQPLAGDELYLVTHPDHPLAKRSGPVTLEELTGHTLVLRGERCDITRRIVGVFQDHGLTPQVLYVGTTEGCYRTVRNGLGTAYLSRFMAEDPVRAGLVKRLHVPELHHEQTLHLGRRPNHRLSGPARHLLDLIKQLVGGAAVAAAGQ